jgi:hypothetical protein
MALCVPLLGVPLAFPPHGLSGGLLPSPLSVRKRGGSLKREAHLVGLGSSRTAHGGKGVEVPEGIHPEFLPSRSPEVQPAERLWHLTSEAIANRLLEGLEELEGALVERCAALCEQVELLRSHTYYHWWPDAA